jgi:hypothetical protein
MIEFPPKTACRVLLRNTPDVAGISPGIDAGRGILVAGIAANAGISPPPPAADPGCTLLIAMVMVVVDI